jgi:hypothetical protein
LNRPWLGPPRRTESTTQRTWSIKCAGYSKVYVDKATVFHSHDYAPEKTRKRARTEAAFYKLCFGSGMNIADAEIAEYRIREFNRPSFG